MRVYKKQQTNRMKIHLSYLYGLILSCCSLTLYGQESVSEFEKLIDQAQEALRSDLKKSTKILEQAQTFAQNDTNKAAVLYVKAQIILRQGKLDENITLCEEALALIMPLKNWKLIADFWLQKHLSYDQMQETEKARACLQNALHFYTQAKDELGEAQVLSNMIIYYHRVNQRDSIYYAYDRAKAIYQNQTTSQESENSLYGNLAMYYNEQGKYDSALFFYLKTLAILEEYQNISGQITTLLNIGQTYSYYGDKKLQKAIDIYSKAIALAEQHKIYRYYEDLLNNRAVAYRGSKQYGLAIQDYNKALRLATENENMGNQARLWYNIGNVRYDQKNHIEAIQAYQNSDKICRNLGIEIGYMYNASGLGKVLLAQKNYVQAQGNFELSLEIAEKMGQIKVVQEMYLDLAKTHAGLKQYQKAYKFQTQYQVLSDSIFNVESDARFAEMETKYETEKKEKENTLLKAKNDQAQVELELQKIQTYASSTGIILVLLIAGLLQRSRLKQRQLNQELEAKNQKISTQAQTLEVTNQKLVELDKFKQTMTSLIAHDLKNPLNTIIGYSENGTEKTSPIIHQSGKRMLNLVQNMLDVQKFEDAQIQPTIENLSVHQLATQAIRQIHLLAQEKNVVIRNDILLSVSVQADAELTERIFVNLLTNALKYSAPNKLIIVNTKIESDKVEIRVKDQGTGIPSEFLPRIFDKFTQVEAKKSGMASSTGLGLTFCKMATEIQGGTIQVKSEFQKGSTFTFSLPQGKSQVLDSENRTAQTTSFSAVEQETLRTYLEKMRKYSIFQVSDLYQVVMQIPEQSQEIKQFKTQLETAIFSGNQEQFDQLVKPFA